MDTLRVVVVTPPKTERAVALLVEPQPDTYDLYADEWESPTSCAASEIGAAR